MEVVQADKERRRQLPGIAFADYKRLSAAYLTIERFSEYVGERKLESSAAVAELRKHFETERISAIIEPVYSFTRSDAKQLVDEPIEGSSNVIGLRITIDSHSPVLAQEMVTLLGEYVVDSIVYLTYSLAARAYWSDLKTRMIRYENIVLESTERLAEHRRKAQDLKSIVGRYPQTANGSSGHTIWVTDDTARYLPPLTQLATAEVQESETRELIRKAKREQAKSALLLEYYGRLRSLTGETKSGEKILRSLETLKDEVFAGKNLEDDVVKQVYNSISIENENAVNVYLQNSRFIAGPTLPTRSTARPVAMLALGLFAGLVASVVLAFVRYWWRDNRTKVRGY
jgi:hypothetical protein